MIREREYGAMSGWGALAVLLTGAAFFVWQLVVRAQVIKEPNQASTCRWDQARST